MRATSAFYAGKASVTVYSSGQDLGGAAARAAAEIIRQAIADRGAARIMLATGNSQIELIRALTGEPDIDWNAVDVFHMDEYAGISANHPASFRRWIKTRVEDLVHPRSVTYLGGDAPDLKGEMRRYADLLTASVMDVALVGFGENGHIAFNDPGVADFKDPLAVKEVTLDEACRRQQAGEGHFESIDAVPRRAITVTCSGLLRASAWICAVPDARKADAVKCALEGPVSEACPASIVRTHPRASVFLDRSSAALLSVTIRG